MPRTVEITVPPERRAALLARVEAMDGVTAILVHPGASHRPPGDVVMVRGTNQAAEDATRIAGELGLMERGSLTITEPLGLASGERRRQIAGDASESTWEEIDTLLRRDTNPSHNFLALMALAGAVAGVGLSLDTLHVVIGAMLIAPGFEPLVRIAVGAASGLGETARRGVLSTLAAYLVLAIGAVVGMLVTAWLDPGFDLASLPEREWVQYWTSVKWTGVAVGVLAGLAGAVVVNSHQTVFATGVMIALALVPGMAIFGMGLAAGEVGLALRGLGRWGVDVGCVLATGLVAFGLKRVLVRRPAHP
jgi:hypothetical protein